MEIAYNWFHDTYREKYEFKFEAYNFIWLAAYIFFNDGIHKDA